MKFPSKPKNQTLTAGLGSAALALLVSAPAVIAETPNPYAMEDDTWITINGVVESVRPDTFTLDYGEGAVIVEMDDGDRDADAYKLLAGDEVTVHGVIDDDFFETSTIEANSVYVDSIGTTFFSSAVDEETANWAAAATVAIPITGTLVYGIVTDVEDHEFTVDSGLREVRVDVDEMPYNPLDDEGYQKVRVGDRVKVSGEIDTDFFEGRELMADSVVKLDMS